MNTEYSETSLVVLVAFFSWVKTRCIALYFFISMCLFCLGKPLQGKCIEQGKFCLVLQFLLFAPV